MNREYYLIALNHWKKFLPQFYKELVQEDYLETALKSAVRSTEIEMRQSLAAGIPRDQAWEELRGRYLLIPPETNQRPQEVDPLVGTLLDALRGTNNPAKM